MKKTFCIVLAAVMLLAAFPGVAFGEPEPPETKSGTCGEEGDGSNLTWTLDEAGTLTISGTGFLKNYTETEAPWSDNQNEENPVKKLVIEPGLTMIGVQAFSELASLTELTIAEGVTYIGRDAFFGCTSLFRVRLPASLKSVDKWAFGADRKIFEVLYAGSEEQWKQISFNITGNIFLTRALKKYNVPVDGPIPTEAPRVLFSGTCGAEDDGSNLTWTLDNTGKLTVSGTGRMNNYLFGYYHMHDEELDNLTYAGWRGWFYLVLSVEIEEGVTNIGENAFRGCYNLQKVTLPESVTEIPESAFDRGSSLRFVRSSDSESTEEPASDKPSEPASDKPAEPASDKPEEPVSDKPEEPASDKPEEPVSDKPEEPASDKPEEPVSDKPSEPVSDKPEEPVSDKPESSSTAGPQTDLLYSGKTGALFWTVDKSGKMTVSGTGRGEDYYLISPPWESAIKDHKIKTLVVEPGVISIGKGWMRGCESLTSVTLPDSVTEIRDYAFRECTGLTSVKLPKEVTYIGVNAFAFCTGLTEITIPEAVETVDVGAFYGCTGLTELSLPDSLKNLNPGAFRGCSGLTRVMVPEGVERVGYDAFRECSSLTGVFLPESLTGIENPFVDCPNLKTICYAGTGEQWEAVGYPSGRTPHFYACKIENGLVLNQEKNEILMAADPTLTSVTIPESASAVADGVFDGYHALSEIRVAEGNQAFSSAEGVFYNKDKTKLVLYPPAKTDETFTLPDSVVSVAEGAFAGNRYLQNVLCGGVETLPNGVFQDCTALKTVFTRAKSIGDRAFSGCASLSAILFTNEMGRIGQDAFAGCDGLNEIFFVGTANEWTSIGVKPGNDALTGARKIFNAKAVDFMTHAGIPLQGGDADGNGKLEAADARAALRAAVGLDVIEAGSPQFKAADADGNSKLEAADARLILRRVVGYTDKEFVA